MLTSGMKISAISWKARQWGLTYGTFQSGLSQEEKQAVYDEFEALMEQCHREEQERLNRHMAEKKKKSPSSLKARVKNTEEEETNEQNGIG